MKAYVTGGIKGFSGKLDGAIYYYHPRLKRTLMRRAPKLPIQQQNLEYRDISRQIKAIDPSEGYRNDFRIRGELRLENWFEKVEMVERVEKV